VVIFSMSFDSALDGVKTQIRKPYEELQSINEDGFIVAMKYSTSANSMMEKDYLLGRFHQPEHIRYDKTGLVKDMAKKFPKDTDMGIYQSFGYIMSRYLIDRPNATWKDVYDFLCEAIKDMSYWVSPNEDEGYLIAVQSPYSGYADMETYPSKEDKRLYVFNKLGWRHIVMIKWTSQNLLHMYVNNHSKDDVGYDIGSQYYEYAGANDFHLGDEFQATSTQLNLLTMMKPVSAGIVNMVLSKSHIGKDWR